MDWIGSQLVECSRGCSRTVKVQNFMLHFKSQCQDYYEHSPAFSERQMAGKVVKQLMAGSSGGDQILQLPTRGQVSYIWKLTNTYRLFCGLANIFDPGKNLPREEFRGLFKNSLTEDKNSDSLSRLH